MGCIPLRNRDAVFFMRLLGINKLNREEFNNKKELYNIDIVYRFTDGRTDFASRK